jgi:hypothetical protein
MAEVINLVDDDDDDSVLNYTPAFLAKPALAPIAGSALNARALPAGAPNAGGGKAQAAPELRAGAPDSGGGKRSATQAALELPAPRRAAPAAAPARPRTATPAKADAADDGGNYMPTFADSEYVGFHSQFFVPTKMARTECFLDKHDLYELESISGGWGFGQVCDADSDAPCAPHTVRGPAWQLRLYRPHDLITKAIAKLGADGFRKKRRSLLSMRALRAARSEAMEAHAEEAKERLVHAPSPADPETARLAKHIRASLRSQLKPKLQLNEHGSPGTFRIEVRGRRRANAPHRLAPLWRQVPGVTAAVFAHLAGIPQDPTLSTLVKKGAFYSIQTFVDDLLQGEVRRMDRGGVLLRPAETVVLTYKPATMLLSVKGDVMFS